MLEGDGPGARLPFLRYLLAVPPLLSLVLALLLATSPAPDPDLDRGLAQVRAGQYDDATETLQGVVRRVYGQPAARPTLVRAYVGLGVASVGLNRLEGARDVFAEALLLDPRLRLGPDEPKEAARVFEEVRAARARSVAPERAAARKKRRWIALGTVAAAGGVAAGIVALAPEAKPEVFTNARLVTPAIACPNLSVSSEVPFSVLVDAAPPGGTLEVRVASVSVVAVETAFSRKGTLQVPRPTTAAPLRLGPGPGTLTLQTTFACTPVFGPLPRIDTWRPVITLATSAGSFYLESRDVLAVSYP